jgi:hypothetical protein
VSSAAPPFHYEFGDVGVFGLLEGFAFDVYGAYGANFGAFSARRAGAGVAPLVVEVHDDLGVFAAKFEVKGVDAFDFVADADATGTQDTSVAVDNEEGVGGVDVFTAPVPLIEHVVYAQLVGEGLEFTVVIGDTDRADMGAFREERLDDHFAVFFEALRICGYRHTVCDGRSASEEKL